LEVDRTVGPVAGFVPGSKAAHDRLKAFCSPDRLAFFEKSRNDPCKEACSGLSPYIHSGQISAQRIAAEVEKCGEKAKQSFESFIEELVVRRELSDNFCFYNPDYDSLKGCSEWAQLTLKVHSADKREHIYTRAQFEAGKTHDDLWNAAQLQQVQDGKMHGFLRMYWAKKILEWSQTPDEALETAIYLNDRFALDGCDPNGYVGCMWSIGGIHDMGWTERPVFGKIRFMNYAGCKRKFTVPAFVIRYPGAAVASKEPEKKAKRAKKN